MSQDHTRPRVLFLSILWGHRSHAPPYLHHTDLTGVIKIFKHPYMLRYWPVWMEAFCCAQIVRRLGEKSQRKGSEGFSGNSGQDLFTNCPRHIEYFISQVNHDGAYRWIWAKHHHLYWWNRRSARPSEKLSMFSKGLLKSLDWTKI